MVVVVMKSGAKPATANATSAGIATAAAPAARATAARPRSPFHLMTATSATTAEYSAKSREKKNATTTAAPAAKRSLVDRRPTAAAAIASALNDAITLTISVDAGQSDKPRKTARRPAS